MGWESGGKTGLGNEASSSEEGQKDWKRGRVARVTPATDDACSVAGGDADKNTIGDFCENRLRSRGECTLRYWAATLYLCIDAVVSLLSRVVGKPVPFVVWKRSPPLHRVCVVVAEKYQRPSQC